MNDFFQNYFKKNHEAIVKDYIKLLSFQTISADSTKKEELNNCAKFLYSYLESCGCRVQLYADNGPPIICATIAAASKEAPTVLIYNHYDVQPVDPLEEWKSDPFTAFFENGKIFARGAQDNKGQLMFVLTALKALKESGTVPCNLIFLIEGEEENGSGSLTQLLQQEQIDLKADFAMIVDAGMRHKNVPAVVLGTRGLIALTVNVFGTKSDLHSGVEGGLAYNPLHALVYMLSMLRDTAGTITVPDFYKEVKMPSPNEISMLSMHFDDDEWEQFHGQKPTGGEKAFSPLERNWLRPTLEINGIHGGYGGEGSKTVIPRKAQAKITCRLVPDQDPMTIAKRIAAYLMKLSPQGITTEVFIHEGMGKAYRSSPHAKGIQALKEAMKEVFHAQAEQIIDGATIPIIPLLQKACGGEILTWGTGLPEDHIHAPNEHFDLERMELGFLTLCNTLEILSATKDRFGFKRLAT
jgi:acetylornithine deacetylase/succinyl-diaminopimelate desuccinylase-like protein